MSLLLCQCPHRLDDGIKSTKLHFQVFVPSPQKNVVGYTSRGQSQSQSIFCIQTEFRKTAETGRSNPLVIGSDDRDQDDLWVVPACISVLHVTASGEASFHGWRKQRE